MTKPVTAMNNIAPQSTVVYCYFLLKLMQLQDNINNACKYMLEVQTKQQCQHNMTDSPYSKILRQTRRNTSACKAIELKFKRLEQQLCCSVLCPKMAAMDQVLVLMHVRPEQKVQYGKNGKFSVQEGFEAKNDNQEKISFRNETTQI